MIILDYDSDFEDKFYNSDYGKIFYKYHKGESNSLNIVFIHGLGASTMSWKITMDYIDPKYNLYLVDLLGHGRSDAPHIDYTVRLQVDILNSFFNYLKIIPVIVGNSYGGWVAALYASSGFPLNGLVLEDSAGLQEIYSKLSEEEIKKAKDQDYENVMRFAGNHDYVIRSIINDESNMRYTLNKENLSKINVPSLIIWGDKDETLPIEYANIFHNLIKGSVLKIIKDSMHIPHFQQPKEFTDDLEEFLESL